MIRILLSLCILLSCTSGFSQVKRRPASADASARWELEVTGEVFVYDNPNNMGLIILTLNTGDVVPISRQAQKGWRSVWVDLPSGQVKGFVKNSDLENSLIGPPVTKPKAAMKVNTTALPYHFRKAFGLNIISSMQSQPARRFSTPSSGEVEMGSFNGTSIFSEIFYDHNLSESIVLRSSLIFRGTEMAGLSRAPLTQISMSQDFIGLGLLAKKYMLPHGNFWYGGGLELSNANSVDMFYNGVSVEVSKSDYPFFMVAQGGLGYDVQFTESLYFVPTLRLGLVANADPVVLLADICFGLAWAL